MSGYEQFNVMIVEDENLPGKILSDNLREKGYEPVLFRSGGDALRYFTLHPVDLALLDYRLPDMTGEELFEKIKEINPVTPVIFMTAYSSVEKAVTLLKMGAYDYLVKPLELDELHHAIRRALEKITLLKENRRLHDNLREKYSAGNYILNAASMQEALNLALRAADSQASILITGESGTGKEVFANIIHQHSPRREKKFLKVNLSAIPETLMEAELFGAVKGAFTGAAPRTGKFEEAHGGVLFLDEIGELSPDIQVKLLRAVQEREITRLGSNEPVNVDFRLITATNRDLQQLIREKKFREDLFFRLNVINIHLPPLRERREDIPLLTDFFIRKVTRREKKNVTAISKDAMNLLIRHLYPGNIRELENIVERAVILARSSSITPQDLPVYINDPSQLQPANDPNNSHPSDLPDNTPENLTLKDILETTERNAILKTLRRFNFNQSQTARALGVSESGLRYRIQALKIPKE